MSGLLIVAQLVFPDKERRKTVIDALDTVGHFSKQSEPGTLRYATFVSRDETDERNIWVIEEYTSQEAFDSHMASKPVQDLIASFAADPTLLSAPPTMTISDLVQGYTRPEISSCADPYIAVGSLEYKEGKRVEALEGWKKVASETEKNEADTLSYGIYKNREHPETVKVVEFYRSEEYFKQVHVPSKAIQENLQKYGNEIRASVSHVWLKHVAGFLVKGKGSSNL